MGTPANVLIIGASRGIGLEFVRQYTGDGARVQATYRKPDDAESTETSSGPILLHWMYATNRRCGLRRIDWPILRSISRS